MVVLPASAGPLLTRELVYTGATRAKKRLTIAGMPDVWHDAVEKRVARASGLAGLLHRE
jgi:exodeoxyribonuclease V alpha subunit